MIAEDKENIRPLQASNNGKFYTGKRTGFTSLLKEATAEVQDDIDRKTAVRSQCKDISNMVEKLCSDFEREDRDFKYAKDVEQTEKEMAKELDEMRKAEEKNNESAALKLAIEERRAQMVRAQAKRDMECKDAEFARLSILNDIDSDFKLEEKCKDDEAYALKVKKEIEDELLAEELAAQEREEYETMSARRRELELNDYAMAKEEQERISKELSKEAEILSARDFDIAREVQSNITLHYVKNKEQQEKEDRMLAKKLITKSARESYEADKRAEILSSVDLCSTASIAAQWKDAEADIQNVMGGICITVLLPHLQDLKITTPKSYVVDIEAKRMVMAGDRHATPANTSYRAEFEIRGRDVKLSKSDMNYNYSSETGLLHIYLESIHVDSDQEEKSERGSALSAIRKSFSRMLSK
mmetsp:Transcript_10381/g.15779  ORF Transcript_10381/g.15779 Transcript_10381/m.15779 type:complete len:414 (-) Transcript_10381:151-1392(-)